MTLTSLKIVENNFTEPKVMFPNNFLYLTNSPKLKDIQFTTM